MLCTTTITAAMNITAIHMATSIHTVTITHTATTTTTTIRMIMATARIITGTTTSLQTSKRGAWKPANLPLCCSSRLLPCP